MIWYVDGTVEVTNSGDTVTGTGTAWVDNVLAGDIFWAPDGRGYQVVEVVSATELTIAPDYAGATATAQSYAISPTQARQVELTKAVVALMTSIEGVRDGAGAGRFASGTAVTPGVRGVDHDGTGLVWNEDGSLSLSVLGALKFGFAAAALTIPGGAAALPGLAFLTDPDTGLYSPEAGALGIAAGGAPRGRFDDDGFRVSGRVRINSFGGSPAAPTETADWPVPASVVRAYDDSYTASTMEMWGLPNDDAYVVDYSIWNLRLHHAPGAIDSSGVTGITLGGPGFLVFGAGAAERMRITAGGNVGIGLADPGDFRLSVFGGQYTASIGSDQPQTSIRLWNGSAGGGEWYIVTGGSGGVASDRKFAIFDWTATATRLQITKFGEVCPGADNAQPMGLGAFRWSVIFSATGTINTSDDRDKLWRGAPSAAELRAGKRIVAELGFFQWHDSIAEKGPDGARYHFGVRAQWVWAIMADEGLVDPIDEDGRPGDTPYAFLCWDEWGETPAVEEVRDEHGNITTPAQPARPAGERYGIRIDQLALFLIAGQEARLAALEASQPS